MSEPPSLSMSMPLYVLLASLAFVAASPVFANEPGAEPVAARPALAPESALDDARDLSAIEDLGRQMDRELTADVNLQLDAIVADRTAQQMRWLEQHYFDGAVAGSRVSRGASPVALALPASQR